MADTIARLKLDSGEFDSKIKRAVTGLQQMEYECRKVGGTLAILEKDQLDYVKALGQMQTVATTTKGKLAELTSAYTELRVQYNRLTDEEKKGDFGKALSSSLDQLKTRIDDTKKELNDVSRELGNTSQSSDGTSNAIEQLTQKFGLNVKQLVGWGTAIAAAKVALDTVKGAIESTEATHDALARTMAVTDNITNQFLRTLATADFSSFVYGLQGIIDKTIEAYNAMDEFESYAARFQPWQMAQESTINTKLQEARAAKAKGDNKKAEELNNEAKRLIDELAASTKAYGEKQTTGGYETIRSLMGAVDITNQQIAWYADPKNWDKAKAKAEEYKRVQEEIDRISRSNITATSYDQQTRRENKARIDQLNSQLNADPSLKRAYTMLNLRDSGDSEQANAFKQALSNIYGNVLADNRISSLRARADRMEGVISRTGSGGSSTVKAASATTKLTEEEKEAARQAKALAEAEKKRAEQLNKLRAEGAEAVRTNSLKSAFAVQKKAQEGGYMGDTSIPLSFTMTQDNVSALMSELKTQINQSDIGSDMYNALTEQLNDVTSLSSLINYAMKSGIDGAELADVSQAMWQQLLGEGDIPDEALQSFKDSIGEALDKSLEFDSEGNVKEGENAGDKSWKEFQKSITQLSGVMSGVSAVGSGLQAMGITLDKDLLGFIGGIQGAISVVQGVISIINALSVPSETANTIAINANTVALGTLATAINSNTFSRWVKPWATGGIVHAAMGMTVPGNHYSGDLVPAMVNSGELILNKAQQGNLAAQLEGGGTLQNLHLYTEVSGENLRIVLRNNNERHGYDDTMTFNM